MRDVAERIQVGALSYSQNSHAPLLSRNQNTKAEASFAHSKRFARFAAPDKGSRRDVPTCARLAIGNAALHDASRPARDCRAAPMPASPVTANATNLALAS